MIRFTVISTGVLVVLSLGCSSSLHHSPPINPPTNLRDFHGQSREAVIDTLGEPTRTDKFPMSQAVGEFRVELYNTYPLTVAQNADVEIEELWWRSEDYWITLWLHQVDGEWVVLDSCKWHKDTRF